MRNMIYSFIISLGILVCSCSNAPIDNTSSDEENYTGSITISIGNRSSRSLTSAEASKLCPYYSIVIFNDTKSYYTSLTGDNSETTVAVAKGTYDVVLVAGGNGSNYGSAYSEGITVKTREITNVELIIKPFTFSISCPSETVNPGEVLTVTYKIDTKNPFLTYYDYYKAPYCFTGESDVYSVYYGTGTRYSKEGTVLTVEYDCNIQSEVPDDDVTFRVGGFPLVVDVEGVSDYFAHSGYNLYGDGKNGIENINDESEYAEVKLLSAKELVTGIDIKVFWYDDGSFSN